jgi:CheY-like chemotaxis protein
VQERLRVLWVNADATVLMVRTVLLEKFGYEVIPATTGKQAIAIVASEDINLAIVDHT